MASASVTNTFTNGTAADAIQVNTNFSDLVTFLNNSVVHRDGTKAFTADQPMGGFKLTGLAAGTVNGDAVRFEQLTADIPLSLIDAAGDLIVGSADNTAARLAIGANGTVLGVTAGALGYVTASGATYKFKAADETVTASTVFQDDDDLFITLAANGIYVFKYHLAYRLSNASFGGFKWQWVEADGTWDAWRQFVDSAGVLQINEVSETDSGQAISAHGNTSSHSVSGSGLIVAGGAGGTFKLQWAQNTAGNSTILEKGSWASFQKLN